MTDFADTNRAANEATKAASVPQAESAARQAQRRRTRARQASEKRFKYMGLAAVLTAAAFLVILLSTIVFKAIPAFTYHYVTLPVDLTSVEKDNLRGGNYRGALSQSLYTAFPDVSGRTTKRQLRGILSAGADVLLQRDVIDNPDMAGRNEALAIPLSDEADLYFKSSRLQASVTTPQSSAQPSGTEDEITIVADGAPFTDVIALANATLTARVRDFQRQINGQQRALAALNDRIAGYTASLEGSEISEATRTRYEEEREKAKAALEQTEARIADLTGQRDTLQKRLDASDITKRLNDDTPSVFVRLNGGVVKLTSVSANEVTGDVYAPMTSADPAAPGNWQIATVQIPQNSRKISDREIVWLDQLKAHGAISRELNTVFFTAGASREPEMAGIWGAIVGSFLTMLITLLLSFPIGVAAAIYLEEFAPKNRFTDFIEVNINNLAAVPSIVFGLLGLGIIVNGLHFGWLTIGGIGPRSAPVTGGMVLALMTLPTIIIASRAALKAVPPSIREAALGVGASPVQTVFHHVLPLAMPGILTGTIIGMAQALGETAPLLMIGMVAFIVDIPTWFDVPATVLPVQIYMWADFPEVAFQQKTSAAILILLGFLVLMNAIAVILRKRFERRW